MAPPSLLSVAFLAACTLGGTLFPVVAFAPSSASSIRLRNSVAPMRNSLRQTSILLFANQNDGDNESNTNEEENSGGQIPELSSKDEMNTNNEEDNIIGSILQRFNSPRIDDPGLPLTDVLVAQIVAPTAEIFWIFLNRAPMPTWLTPISSYFGEAPELAPRGSLLAPTLIHGAGLAVCWLAGALAARMYEREAFFLEGGEKEGLAKYQTLISRLIQSGAFATGILILSTQLDLLLEFKRYVQFGESDQTDSRLVVASVEVINDVFFEGLVISTWRIIHANFMSTPENRSRRF